MLVTPAAAASIPHPPTGQEGRTSPPSPTSPALLSRLQQPQDVHLGQEVVLETLFSVWKEALPNPICLKPVVYLCGCV